MCPLVSVIIPTFNSFGFLIEAVDSALAQTYQAIEIIVVDDGSTDDSAQVAARYGDRIRYIRQDNQGPSGARNTGIRNSRGRFIAFLDADDRWLPGKLARQVPLLEADISVGLVHSSCYIIDAQGIRVGTKSVDLTEDCDIHALLERNRVSCLTAVVRRAALDTVGLFDTSLRGPEDWDLWLRIAAKYTVMAAQEPLAEYRVTDGSVSKNARRMYQDELHVLMRSDRLHGDCETCRQATIAGRANAKARYAFHLKTAARAARARGRTAEALFFRLQSFYYDRADAARFVMRTCGC